MPTSRIDLDRIVQAGFLSPDQAETLRAAGIQTGPQLATAWQTPSERQRLTAAANMPVEALVI